jgi:hypothetical protein
MANKIFQTILHRKIESFTSTFVEDSHSIFFNGSQLIHPGEYGRYRENSMKELLQILTKYKVSDGFIITNNNKVSTQCDIVIYDNQDFPILENNFTQFFSIESVISIGEVKSTLNKIDFYKALRKLSDNKKLSEDLKAIPKVQGKGREYNFPISFLVCKDLSFDISKCDFEEVYKDIPREYWHNFILVVDKGISLYNFKFKNFTEPHKVNFRANNGDLDSSADIETPFVTFYNQEYNCDHIFNQIDSSDKYHHITTFLAGISQAISYKTHILNYSGLTSAKVFK